MKAAVFLDRDGVLVEDSDLIIRPEQFRVLPAVPDALARLRRAGFALVVVSNQAVVARGLATEEDVRRLNQHLEGWLVEAGAPRLEGWYFCPHHPSATLPAYRLDCDCRKPRPGMLRQAARDLRLDLNASFMVGDRWTDVAAGVRAGCRTVLVQTGRHTAPPIETAEPIDPSIKLEFVCADLAAAADWILGKR